MDLLFLIPIVAIVAGIHLSGLKEKDMTK